ncbi:hypothetical protein KKB83_01970 [Patescibacteria group bacterium]|nr:hypothetical protein [Patescibacteria group bacterium]
MWVMGYSGKILEKRRARKLRNKGLSYREIQKEVPVAKSTLSLWCRDIILTLEQMERLKKKRLQGAEKGRFIGAKRQQAARIARTKKLLEKGKGEVGKLSKRDRFIAGTGLYLGDGNKTDSQVGFSNSNPKIISFMIRWFREFCEIPEEKLRGQIWIHDNQNEKHARLFWSNLTNIPLCQFKKSYIAKNKINSKKIRKNLHKHGVLSVRVSNVAIQRKILGWMAGILGVESV